MATKASTAVGSASWIATEKENVQELLQQEREELIYPAQHEIEWLNEHMAEIFSRSQVNVTDVFKTPGKLRGKTPRTARKRNVADARIPLSDIFSSKPHLTSSPARESKQLGNLPSFVIAQDAEVERAPYQTAAKSQTDSGYHGSSQDAEIDVTEAPAPSLSQYIPSTNVPHLGVNVHAMQTSLSVSSQGGDRRVTEGSFHSAKEEQTTRIMPTLQSEEPRALKALNEGAVTDQNPVTVNAENADVTVVGPVMEEIDFQQDLEDIGSPSDESTPDKLLVRKSSLNFASLPAREPLKSTTDGRISRTSNLTSSRMQISRTSVSQRLPVSQPPTNRLEGVEMSEDENVEILGPDDSDSESRATKQYSKFSTQRLHEKIDMLGKAGPRPSKSIPSAATFAASQVRQPEAATRGATSTIRSSRTFGTLADDDDEWIKPLKSSEILEPPYLTKSYTADATEGVATEYGSEADEFDIRAPELIAHEERMKTPVRMSPSPGKVMGGFGHTKSASTATLMSPEKAAMAPPPSPAKSISVSNPAMSSTTPQGSPKRFDLTASKSKLHSIMKTAKGLFTSSAGVSAAAKMETLSPEVFRMAANNMPGLYPSIHGMLEDKPLPASPPKHGRKTRSSTEREKEARVMQKMDEQLQKVREKESQKATQHRQAQGKLVTAADAVQAPRNSPRRHMDEQKAQDTADMPPPSIQSQAGKGLRPGRLTREASFKPKPLPVSIRVGTLSQRMPMSTSALSSGIQETLPAEPKRPDLTKKISNASLPSSASTANFKASVNTQAPKPKALLAAERKREQDEREAQRKLEQKREMERRRAAQQEEARRQEQKQRTDAERKERERLAAEQAKRQAQQQAIEKKRLENARKAEQQRVERAINDNAPSARPPSRLGAAQQPLNRSLIGHPLPTNPAKPAKRPFEEEAGPHRLQPSSRFGAASQQDAKRRKTEDEIVVEAPRPTMSGAPIRQSNLGKKPSIFNHSSYAQIQTQAQQGQFSQASIPRIAHPSVMAQYGNGAKIPFAEASNPPAHAAKTPVSAYQQNTTHVVKSSPHYPNGEAIHLPEIPTDSEDEDSETETNAFPIPDWATPGHLTNQLMLQEGMDGDAVFGPIAPLKMEEIFAKGNKERLKRMRDRTSSANWAMSGDGLTLEEVRADREQRERMRVEGGWRYGN